MNSRGVEFTLALIFALFIINIFLGVSFATTCTDNAGCSRGIGGYELECANGVRYQYPLYVDYTCKFGQVQNHPEVGVCVPTGGTTKGSKEVLQNCECGCNGDNCITCGQCESCQGSQCKETCLNTKESCGCAKAAASCTKCQDFKLEATGTSKKKCYNDAEYCSDYRLYKYMVFDACSSHACTYKDAPGTDYKGTDAGAKYIEKTAEGVWMCASGVQTCSGKCCGCSEETVSSTDCATKGPGFIKAGSCMKCSATKYQCEYNCAAPGSSNADTSCGCDACTNCNTKDSSAAGWYPVGNPQPGCTGGKACSQIFKMENRDYYCQAYTCDDPHYNVLGTKYDCGTTAKDCGAAGCDSTTGMCKVPEGCKQVFKGCSFDGHTCQAGYAWFVTTCTVNGKDVESPSSGSCQPASGHPECSSSQTIKCDTGYCCLPNEAKSPKYVYDTNLKTVVNPSCGSGLTCNSYPCCKDIGEGQTCACPQGCLCTVTGQQVTGKCTSGTSDCKDTDGGSVSGMQGTCSGINGVFSDTCNGDSLVEYSCTFAGSCSPSAVSCPSGQTCSGGRCAASGSSTSCTPAGCHCDKKQFCVYSTSGNYWSSILFDQLCLVQCPGAGTPTSCADQCLPIPCSYANMVDATGTCSNNYHCCSGSGNSDSSGTQCKAMGGSCVAACSTTTLYADCASGTVCCFGATSTTCAGQCSYLPCYLANLADAPGTCSNNYHCCSGSGNSGSSGPNTNQECSAAGGDCRISQKSCTSDGGTVWSNPCTMGSGWYCCSVKKGTGTTPGGGTCTKDSECASNCNGASTCPKCLNGKCGCGLGGGCNSGSGNSDSGGATDECPSVAWQNDGCGKGTCDPTYMRQIKTCNGVVKEQCLGSASCSPRTYDTICLPGNDNQNYGWTMNKISASSATYYALNKSRSIAATYTQTCGSHEAYSNDDITSNPACITRQCAAIKGTYLMAGTVASYADNSCTQGMLIASNLEGLPIQEGILISNLDGQSALLSLSSPGKIKLTKICFSPINLTKEEISVIGQEFLSCNSCNVNSTCECSVYNCMGGFIIMKPVEGRPIDYLETQPIYMINSELFKVRFVPKSEGKIDIFAVCFGTGVKKAEKTIVVGIN